MPNILKVLTFVFIYTNLILPQIPDKEYFKEHLEVYFEFDISDYKELDHLTRIISIDNVKEKSVYAYANAEEWSDFIKLGYTYRILPHPGVDPGVRMSNDAKNLGSWDTYPTYDAYVQMMNQFASNYPGICRIVEAGNTVNGRKILFAVISDNVGIKEAEPQFMFSSTMHGDETTGYVLMLRLIDSLLTSYGTDTRITNLVDNVEIWINPNGNPDGTYYGGNNTVGSARRYNANGKDINRNFPDPAAGPNPTGAWQPETIAMMSLADSNRFVLSANFHGGAEVVNYPWDAWSRLHPDNNWYYMISRKYADTAQANSPSGYLNDLNNGVTNGYAWYQVLGGRQDYFTYFKRGREVTIEISSTKLLSASLLPAFWNYNKRSFLSYIENCLYGVRGVVTDTLGNPVTAKVSIVSHDFDSSEVITDWRNGNYHRMLYPGTYSVNFSADGFIPKTVSNVIVEQGNTVMLNIELSRTNIPVELTSFSIQNKENIVELRWTTATELNNHGFEVERRKNNIQQWEKLVFLKGNATTTEPSYYYFEDRDLPNGNYRYRLKQIDFNGNFTYSQVVDAEVKVESFSLFRNYPNPFNPSTMIKYSIGESEIITLKVVDVLGREVSVLVNEKQDPGIHEVLFDGSNLSSGVYLIVLSCEKENGSIILSRKINLIK